MPAYTINAGIDEVVIQSTLKITLQVGSNTVTIDPSGVTIKCLNFNVEADMATQLKSLMHKEEISGIKQVQAATEQHG